MSNTDEAPPPRQETQRTRPLVAEPGVAADEGDAVPSIAQRRWLRRGLDQPGGKLPLFDRAGQRVSPRVVEACVASGWAQPWFNNPLKPDWQVCQLTERGRAAAAAPATDTETPPQDR